MANNNFIRPNKSKTNFNFFKKLTVTASNFDGYQSDITIPFSTYTVTFFLESGSSVQYSFDGVNVHGDMTSGQASATLTFQNRVISRAWFKGTGTVRIEAWGLR